MMLFISQQQSMRKECGTGTRVRFGLRRGIGRTVVALKGIVDGDRGRILIWRQRRRVSRRGDGQFQTREWGRVSLLVLDCENGLFLLPGQVFANSGREGENEKKKGRKARKGEGRYLINGTPRWLTVRQPL